MKLFQPVAAIVLTLASATSALAQPPGETPAQRIAAQREAMAVLAMFDGVWRGPAVATLAGGVKHELTQTERVGPFLDGSVKVMEGRGYEADGKVAFNAFGTISYNGSTKAYTLHSNAQGYAGDFALTPIPNGFIWQIAAGPATMRYTATVNDGVWHEVGDRIMPGKEPVRVFEMNLKRVGDTTWPAGGAVSQK